MRRPAQVAQLRELGAEHVLDSSSPSFTQDLVEAIAATNATLAFDAIGGGRLAGKILSCMELAIKRTAKEYSRYGSATHKQVYVYGMLDPSPIEFVRNFGMAWSMGGWLLMPFMQTVGPEVMHRLKDRVRRELKTTFATHYSRHVSLFEALQADVIAKYAVPVTGEKFLIVPNVS